MSYVKCSIRKKDTEAIMYLGPLYGRLLSFVQRKGYWVIEARQLCFDGVKFQGVLMFSFISMVYITIREGDKSRDISYFVVAYSTLSNGVFIKFRHVVDSRMTDNIYVKLIWAYSSRSMAKGWFKNMPIF